MRRLVVVVQYAKSKASGSRTQERGGCSGNRAHDILSKIMSLCAIKFNSGSDKSKIVQF